MASSGEVAVARAVLIHGPLSRAALTARLDLSAASLTRLAKPLLDSGVLVEVNDVADGSVGRPSRPLDIAPHKGRFVGVKLTGTHLYAVSTGIRAEPMAWIDHPLTDRSPGGVIDDIARSINNLEIEDLTGVGVSLGGFVRHGVVEHAPFLEWHGVHLAELLSERVGAPVTVENDVVALAEAERWFGIGRDLPGFAIVTIGAGVGYGLVVGGQAVRTVDAGAGTGGHIPLAAGGPVCPDGHRGCAQAVLTSGAIAGQVSAALQRPVSYDEVLRLASAGEPSAQTVVNAAGDALGRFIALAANLTLQSSVVLAGEGIGIYDLVAHRVTNAVHAERGPNAEPVHIHVDRSGFRAWARGAAAVSIQTAIHRLPA
ncbi:ROK family protein [Arthrobacter sp. CAN_C5]|uniref:ROK family protein n=1 Tax=Arthrobacter sp. CAN_C5 TaxID=2760706 RepID=UPI001AE946D5|nr:ROK family protein [Arthrobacter sp. CAN_C5]MBP2217943.1 putative NBD/HSP70 family sugar kinase [Arthrobacter sp. CAN_C5]